MVRTMEYSMSICTTQVGEVNGQSRGTWTWEPASEDGKESQEGGGV